MATRNIVKRSPLVLCHIRLMKMQENTQGSPMIYYRNVMESRTDQSLLMHSTLGTGRGRKVHNFMKMSLSGKGPILIMGFNDSLLGRYSLNDMFNPSIWYYKISAPDPISCKGLYQHSLLLQIRHFRRSIIVVLHLFGLFGRQARGQFKAWPT